MQATQGLDQHDPNQSPTTETPTITIEHHEDFRFRPDGVCGACGEPYGWFYSNVEGNLKGVPLIPRLCRCKREEAEAAHLRELRQKEIDRERAIERLRRDYLENLPRKLHECRVNNYRMWDGLNEKELASCSKAKSDVTGYIQSLRERRARGQGLIFYGTNGSGKSHLAAAIGSAAVAQGYSVQFLSARELIPELRNCDFGNTEPIMRPLKRCTFLIIDDLGTEDDTESAKSKIHELVKYRHDQMNPTIFTTNLRIEDVRDRYNPRTIDCIFESGLNQIIKIACKSYRQEVGVRTVLSSATSTASNMMATA